MRAKRWANIALAVPLAVACLTAGAAPPNDPYAASSGAWTQEFPDQWALDDQRIYADIAPTRNGEKVIVAVIDTGIDYNHEDLAGEKIWRNENEQANGRDDDGNGYADDLIGWNFVGDNGNPYDESGHGTHIAGIIAACTNNGIGIAATNIDAVVMPLKVASFVGQAKSSDVAAAIYYAVDHGAAIINISLGGELITELEKQAAQYAHERGVLVVVSAGNRGLPTDKHGYAGLPHALVVGALAPNGERAGFSNFGGALALLAPGVDILSLRAKDSDFIALSEPLDYQPGAAIVGEGEQYYRATGTSFAAAVVSGVASRLKSMRPELTGTDLARVVEQSAFDVAPPGHDQLSGAGKLDYIAALGADASANKVVRLSGAKLALADKQLWVDITGRYTVNDFQSASLYVRPVAGSIPTPKVEETKDRRKKRRKKKDEEPVEDPYRWQLLTSFSEPNIEGVLTRLNTEELTTKASGSTQWELRLTVNEQHSAFLSLALPQPEEFLVEEEWQDD